MKFSFTAAAAVLAAGLLAACQSGNESVPAQQTTPVTSSTYTERTTTEASDPRTNLSVAATADFTPLQQEILSYVNQARSKSCQCGSTTYPAAPALVLNDQLNSAAQKYATDMATYNYFSHTGRDGSQPWDRMQREGYSWRYAGENIAAGYTTARAVVDGWLRSPGHCANIMNKNYKDLGVGYAYGASSTYKYYWVNDFGAK
jgi:uncharacterized protein YkwD